ncbi:uncharacterized protein LOC100830803 [Brachypodium distachyon]|uniref:Uncharacterized protein n=1 Tax=Brachypodium distachyon TaxID=15368 RepID=I1GWX8_BRADI|nr:uncharacterized protein LOC100830803 [Brachypodium distachyon]KQK17506.1 hypothetical protein BRADI_1g34867v3 [Brachypodium distachyon]|eukprot:XP_003563546.1 uncharacterized protein LOC100830803 [Brachypodium distachyon]
MAYSKGVGGGGGGMSAVDAILAEAADLVALEQIARLNTAHLDGSPLPSSLESRFRKLKSLPTAPAPPAKTLGRSATAPLPPHQLRDDDPLPQAPARASQELRPDDAPGKLNSPPPVTTVPAVRKEDEDDEEEDLERLFGPARRGRPTLRERNRGMDSDDSLSPPPPRQACCFGFSSSPKKPPSTRRKKSHPEGAGNDVLGLDADEWGDENRRMVTELKAQQRKMKEALEEQVKVSRETAKMARWVKQASARMTHTAAIDDLLSDIDDEEELK